MTSTTTDFLNYLSEYAKEKVSTFQAGTDYESAADESDGALRYDIEKDSYEIEAHNEITNNIENISRIYPHVYDENTAAGKVRNHLINSHEDAQLALDAFGDADLESVSYFLSKIAVKMKSAHPHTEFNESLGGVISFIRRAMLSATIENISRGELNSLVCALQAISNNPMIDLEDAGEIVTKLTDEGWQGEHGFAASLLVALFDDLDLDTDAIKQSSLFEDKIE